jgi:uncharacterized membrane protein YhaH (DUF805 family)
MTFHPTVRDRFVYILILVTCVGLVIASAFFFVRSTGSTEKQFGQSLGITSMLLLVALYLNWLAWSSKVRLHDQGVSWSEGKNSGTLVWDNIAGFGWKTEKRYLRVGLVEKTSRELRILPFLSPALYAALRERCGRLPAEMEKTMGFRG